MQTRAELSRALDEIRRLVDELRPPVLDELGMAGSIMQQREQFPGIRIVMENDGVLHDLPAAVEVAAYRIVLEAVTNAARHSNAELVTVRLRRPQDLKIEIVDDGSNTTTWVAGVGITSMTDRATELGGTLTSGPIPTGGGRVSATFPVLA